MTHVEDSEDELLTFGRNLDEQYSIKMPKEDLNQIIFVLSFIGIDAYLIGLNRISHFLTPPPGPPSIDQFPNETNLHQ